MTNERVTPTKKRQPRSRVVPLWRTRPVIISGIIAGIGLLGVAGWGLAQTSLPEEAFRAVADGVIEASAAAGLRVADVYVVGRDQTPKADLLEAVGINRGDPILAVDLDAVRDRVEQLPWVRSAAIERVLPGAVIVHLTERHPIAVWQYRGHFSLIDDQGHLIPHDDISPFGHLFVVVGEDAPEHVGELLSLLDSEPQLRSRVTAAVWVGDRRWNLRFNDGVDVLLPEQDPQSAWRRLAEYDRLHGLLSKGLQSIDLRFSDRLILQKQPSPEIQKQGLNKNA